MSKKRILLIEDNAVDCKAVDRALKNCYSSAQLDIRMDPVEAMELLEGASYQPDLILLDTVSDGSDREQLAKKIQTDTSLCSTPMRKR